MTRHARALAVVFAALLATWAAPASAQRPPPAAAPPPSPATSAAEGASPGAAPPPAPPPAPEASSASPSPSPPPPPPEEPAAEKPSFSWGGRVFTYGRVPIDHPVTGSLQQVSTSVWLEGKARFNDATSAHMVLTADALTPSLDGKTELRGHIREAYATAHGHGLELRVGQQIISWGNADGVNVLDLLSGTDFRFFSADPEVRKTGAISTYFSWVPGEDGPVEIDLVWQPLAPISTLLFPLDLIPQGVTLADPVRPKPSLSNSEVASKIKYTGSGFDIAAIGFYGYNHLPEFYLAKRDAQGITIGQTNYRYLATGGEASFTAGKWIFRAEGSYTFTESRRGEIAFIQPSYFGGILGIERPFGERVRVTAQGVVRYYPYWTDPVQQVGADPALQGIARANSITQNYTDPFRPGATLRAAYTSENEAFEAEVFGLYYFIGRDYVVRPAVGYRLSDAFKVQLGAEYFGGSKDRSVGSLNPFSGVFAQATFTF